MKKNEWVLIVTSMAMFIVLACQFGSLSVDENAVATAAQQTISAKQPTLTPNPPTLTPLPTYTPQLPPTTASMPCNKAKFISETVEDHTKFSPNEEFTKTWRLENIGTCTWNTNYRVALQSGNAMGVSSPRYFTQIIQPGEKMDVVLEMKAPSSKGGYTSWWQLQDDRGNKFGQISVVILVN